MKLKILFTRLFSIPFIQNTLGLSTITYFVLRFILFLKLKSPYGDEHNFIKVFNDIIENGFITEWSNGNISPLYYILAYPLNSFINSPLLSLRLISVNCTVISMLLLYIFASKHLKLKKKYLYSACIFSISFLGYRLFWQGINDGIFHLLIIISFFSVYNIHYNINLKKNLLILGLIIGLLIGIRIIAFLVIPGYFFFLYKSLKNIIIVGFTALIIGFSLHMPSIVKHHKMSSVDKNPSHYLTWAQLNYLSQQYIYEGKIKENQRISWKDLESYLKVNNENMLPKTFIESVTFNPLWTLKELFNDFWDSLKQYFIFLNLGLLILIWFTYYGLKEKLTEKFKLNYNFLLFFWSHTFFISLVVLTQIEVRWYTPFIYLVILLYHEILAHLKLSILKSKRVLFLKLNLIILLLFQLKFIFTDSNLFSDFFREVLNKSVLFISVYKI